MAKVELRSFPSPAELASAAAKDWLQAVAEADRYGRSLCVGLSGGRIAQPLFEAVCDGARTEGVSLSHVHFFWADERCVLPQDPESNFAAADRLLFQPLGIAASQVHRVRGEWPPQQAAAEAASELKRLVRANGAGVPELDLVFLGMGEDGHVASLFPDGEMLREPQQDIYAVVKASKPPPMRISLTYEVLAAAREVLVLASGPGKEKALSESLADPGRTPLGRVIGSRAKTRILTDIPVSAPAG
jgi:6-phosphogluconolactonase